MKLRDSSLPRKNTTERAYFLSSEHLTINLLLTEIKYTALPKFSSAMHYATKFALETKIILQLRSLLWLHLQDCIYLLLKLSDSSRLNRVMKQWLFSVPATNL